MFGLYVHTDKGFYSLFEYSVCKLVKIVLKIMWTACMKIGVLWKAACFAGLDPLPLWELLKFDFLEMFSVKIKPASFSCTNIIPALIINYTRSCEVTLKSLKEELFRSILKALEKVTLLSAFSTWNMPFLFFKEFYTLQFYIQKKAFVLFKF